MSIKQILSNFELKQNDKSITENENKNLFVHGWVRTLRSSSNSLLFCNINDGSNTQGLQLILSDEEIEKDKIENFNKSVQTGTYIKCSGPLVDSPAAKQKFEMKVKVYWIIGEVGEGYPLSKTKINLDTLRLNCHLRSRTNTFGSIFRIRSSLMKSIHDFFHNLDYLHLDPNIITINECEGGAGVFQLTEKDINDLDNLKFKDKKYIWNNDHFNKPAYLTVSSQLQLEAMACSLGNVYTVNKSFRSEHSNTTKHVSEFTHLEIEIINNTLNELMDVGEELIKFSIEFIMKYRLEDIENLNSFMSKGIIDKLKNIKNKKFNKIKYVDLINEINDDIDKDKKIKLEKLKYGEDLGSKYEDYITKKYDNGVFVTHWPISIKSFYMKQSENNECECFDLLMPYGIGELIGGSQREENLEKLLNMMKIKGVDENNMKFYTDLRKYGTCVHGGFGLGFDRLLMMITGIQNIKDVIPFPVHYKSCHY